MKKVYLYRISQDVNVGYDTYDSAVVSAYSEDEAKCIHPSTHHKGTWGIGDWCESEYVNVELIGEAIEGIEPGSVICASFNAG